MIYFHPKPTGGCVITMSDQETGAPPPDPNTPATTSETAEPAPESEGTPLSPDQIEGPREGGGYDKQESADEDEDED